MSAMARPIMIAAGGTGGHIYPALAVAAQLQKRGRTLFWLGNADGMEARLSEQHGYQLLPLRALPLRGKGIVGKAMAMGCLLLSVLRACAYIYRYKPALMLAMGGYVSAAGAIAAWLWRVPLCLHEQNAVPGLVNRWLAPLAKLLLEGYRGSFARANAVYTGNPVRSEFANADSSPAGNTDQLKRVLLLGGSQGAAALNATMPQAWQLMREQMDLRLHHQSGANNFAAVRNSYADDAKVQVSAYIEDMYAALCAADLVVCRAGAMTLAEVSAAAVPAIIIPYRYSADNHQLANATFMQDANAAVLITEDDCNPKMLADTILGLLREQKRLASMGNAAKKLSAKDSAACIADLCLEVAHG